MSEIYTLVENESCDWYVIPFDKKDEWWDKWHAEDDLPKWAIYVQDPGHVTFTEWKCTL